MNSLKITITVVILAITGACNNPGAGDTNRDTGEQPSQSDSIDLTPITFKEWQEKLSSYEPDIVVVDLWATWCQPCIERFPHMVEMHERYHDKGVRFVSMNLDSRDDTQALTFARQFLVKTNATFENYLMNENMMDAFEMLDLLGIPAVYIYDRNGQERIRLTGDNPNKQFTDKDVEDAIISLLAQPG